MHARKATPPWGPQIPRPRIRLSLIADRYLRSRTALSEIFDERTVVLDHRTGTTVHLNAAAGSIWAALASPQTVDEIAARLTSQFAIPLARARQDALAALEELERQELVTRSPGDLEHSS
ncbi:MAG TPA: PqqD family protein [Solirubrobacteraceae bacterium]|jgi:hypothetical protein|nr:PqqD family protein [Solirubrobacteraceae bacterium]